MEALTLILNDAFPSLNYDDFLKMVSPKYKKHPELWRFYEALTEERNDRKERVRKTILDGINERKHELGNNKITMDEVIAFLRKQNENLDNALERTNMKISDIEKENQTLFESNSDTLPSKHSSDEPEI